MLDSLRDNKLGDNVLYLYITLTYGLGFIFSLIFNFDVVYPGFYGNNLYPLFIIPITLISVIITNKTFFKAVPFGRKINVVQYLDNGLVLQLFALIFLVLSCFFFIQYGYQFRHSRVHILDANRYIIVLYYIKYYFLSYILYDFITFVRNPNKYKSQNLLHFVISLALLLCWTGALDIIYVFALLCTFLPHKMRSNIFTRKHDINFKRHLAVLVTISGLFFTVFVFGFVNKLGINNTFDKLRDLNSTMEFTAVEYLSNSYASLIIAGNTMGVGTSEFKEQLASRPFKLFKYRVNHLLGGISSVDRPKETSIASYNYKITRGKHAERFVGASPGLMATFFYLPYFPLFFILGVLMLSFFIKILNDLNLDLSVYGVFVVYIFLYFLFKNPIDYFFNFSNPLLFYCLMTYLVVTSFNLVKNKVT